MRWFWRSWRFLSCVMYLERWFNWRFGYKEAVEHSLRPLEKRVRALENGKAEPQDNLPSPEDVDETKLSTLAGYAKPLSEGIERRDFYKHVCFEGRSLRGPSIHDVRNVDEGSL